jgi:hypothetical protein
VEVVVGDLESDSGVMVDWEEEREKVLARGARWVSLSSMQCQPSYTLLVPFFNYNMGMNALFVSFQDILAYISCSWASFYRAGFEVANSARGLPEVSLFS